MAECQAVEKNVEKKPPTSDNGGKDEEEMGTIMKVDSSNATRGFGCRHVGIQRPLPLLSPVKQNVDLNRPPPNWLRQSGAGHYFHKPLFSQFNNSKSSDSSELQPSSITLASHYSHIVGDAVDVIADTKSVKKLLMIPYNKSNISMSIHRLGKTLLIDELSTEDSLKLSSIGDLPKVSLRKKDPVSVRHRSMYSKLLYYSTQDDSHIPMLPAPEHSVTLPDPESARGADREETRDVKVNGEDENEGTNNEENSDKFPCLPPEPSSQPFHLNVEWTVSDIRMLLGSDLPIFGKEGQPAISLRLRDMEKPITVLTGLDYWLDNLMCNVPELAMCYHIDGIVQKFDIIKTEDIPKLDKNCQFSPHEVLKVAENILSFLKANCTREGHTYWLFRPKGEDLVKLYDLTPLTTDHKETEAIKNPFAKSVAILFYRVSQRMLGYGRHHSKKDINNIKVLLENCIKLLHNDLNSQIVMSSYYLLADLFLSHTPSEDAEEEEESSDDEHVKESRIIAKDERHVSSFTVSRLRESIITDTPSLSPSPSSSILHDVTNTQDATKLALNYISSALTGVSPVSISGWQLKGTSQLLQKAGHAYWKLADSAMAANELGKCLRWSRLVVLCIKVALALSKDKRRRKDMNNMLWSSWQLCGDVHVLSTKASKSFSAYLDDFNVFDVTDCKMKAFISSLYNPSIEEENCLQLHADIETSLKMSLECYKVCESLVGVAGGGACEKKLKERLGNAWNELGVYYKQVAAAIESLSDKEGYFNKSYDCLTKGTSLFQETQNIPNQALLHANLGSLMRTYASIVYSLMKNERRRQRGGEGGGGGEGGAGDEGGEKEGGDLGEFTPEERMYYNRSIDYYNKGKEILKRQSANPGIWLSIEMDLSNVYYEMGHKIQERPPLSSVEIQEIERDIVSLYMKGLHHAECCLNDVAIGSPQHISLCLVLGSCHHQLASLYHKMSFDSSFPTQKQRQTRSQSERHYTKAIDSYLLKHQSLQLLRVYLERALLYEQQAKSTSSKQSVRFLYKSLDDLISSLDVLKEEKGCKEERDVNSQPLSQLVNILICRLQTVCKQLLSVSLKRTSSQDDSIVPYTVTQYKLMYSTVLGISHNETEIDHNNVIEALERLKSITDKQS